MKMLNRKNIFGNGMSGYVGELGFNENITNGKSYKLKDIGNIRMFPSDLTGSLDVFSFIFGGKS